MPFIEVESGINMHYEDRGEGDALVFIHGWGGSADVWDLQVLDLAGSFRCITVDLRGHGESDKPWGTYDYDMFVRDIDALITGLGLEGVTLIGWSMGGHIALKYAHERPAKLARVVLTGSGPRFSEAEDAPYGTPASEAPGLIDAVRYARTETIAGLYGNNFHRSDLTPTKDWFVQIGWKVPAFIGLDELPGARRQRPARHPAFDHRAGAHLLRTSRRDLGPALERGGTPAPARFDVDLLREQRARRVR